MSYMKFTVGTRFVLHGDLCVIADVHPDNHATVAILKSGNRHLFSFEELSDAVPEQDYGKLNRVEIDATLFDVFVVDKTSRLPISSPLLSIAEYARLNLDWLISSYSTPRSALASTTEIIPAPQDGER
jgi:hypothetical protein